MFVKLPLPLKITVEFVPAVKLAVAPIEKMFVPVPVIVRVEAFIDKLAEAAATETDPALSA